MVSRKYSTELMLRKELMKLWSMDLKERKIFQNNNLESQISR
jgi:hypothetical protein